MGQELQPVKAPAEAKYLPGVHGVQEERPARVSVCLPAGQVEQLEAPEDAAYVPALHSEQVEASGPEYLPAPQISQALLEPCPYLPSGQLLQMVAPEDVAYIPEVQAVQSKILFEPVLLANLPGEQGVHAHVPG